MSGRWRPLQALPYSAIPNVGSPIASIFKSNVWGIPAPCVLNPVSNFLGLGDEGICQLVVCKNMYCRRNSPKQATRSFINARHLPRHPRSLQLKAPSAAGPAEPCPKDDVNACNVALSSLHHLVTQHYSCCADENRARRRVKKHVPQNTTHLTWVPFVDGRFAEPRSMRLAWIVPDFRHSPVWFIGPPP